MSKPKQGVMGKPKSTSLFRDGTYDQEEFRQTFLKCDDSTEYTAALKLVGSWQEWLRLKKDSVWFRAKVRQWLEELEMKQRSESIQAIRKLAKSDKASAFQANKWMAEKGYDKTTERGRPSKAELAKEARELAREAGETKEEIARIEAAIGARVCKA